MTSAIDSAKILSKWDAVKDSCADSPKKALKWSKVGEMILPYTHSRPLPVIVAREAIDYIAVITRSYPFQIRFTMALPLWERFSSEWCSNGNAEKALRAI